MDVPYFRKAIIVSTIIILLVASFFILKPILLSIVAGFLLAFIFSPIYRVIYKWTKAPNFSATLVCLFLIAIIVIPVWLFTPMVIDQTFKIYLSAQKTDFVGILRGAFPSLFSSEQFSAEIGSQLQTFITRSLNSILNVLSNFILNISTIVLQLLVIMFTFFFALRDKNKLIKYLKEVSPFSKDIEDKVFKYSRDITAFVLYGHIIIGSVEGIILGIGLFIFGVPNALILGILAIIAGILPIVGPMLIWVPVLIYLLIAGNTFAAFGILVFGLIASNIEHLLRPLLISKMTELHSGIVLIGMIGGLFVFGLLGLLIGPLILAYLIIILESYREKSSKEGTSKLFIKEN